MASLTLPSSLTSTGANLDELTRTVDHIYANDLFYKGAISGEQTQIIAPS